MTSLSVVLLTYNRPEYAERTLRTALANLRMGEDYQVHVHIADDGTGREYRERLVSIAEEYDNTSHVTCTDSQRGGYGRNYNLAMQVAHQTSPVVLPLEDDWELTRPLDVMAQVGAMTELGIGCLRLGYIGYTQPLRGTFAFAKVGGHYLVMDGDSPEPHVFAGHPRLETVAWARSVGPWPEGLLPGETEFAVAHIPAARQGVAWPLDLVPPQGGLFAHIGSVRSY